MSQLVLQALKADGCQPGFPEMSHLQQHDLFS